MKNNRGKLSIIILFISVFIIFSTNVKALDINSDYYIYNNESHSIKLKNINSSLNFFVGSQIYKDSERVYISGNFSNSDYLYDTIYTKTLFFDANKDIITICDSEDNLLGKGFSSVAFYCGIDESNFNNNKTINDIKYYKILISVNTPISSEDEINYSDNQNIYYETPKENTTNDYSSYSSNNEYNINKYDININVNENNTFNITEKIDTFFNVEKHGIFRKIPLRNDIVRLDGTTSKNRAKVSDIKVSNNYSLSTESEYKIIKIGDANRILKGQNSYEISYLYSLDKDKEKDYDELYFNIIGDEWDTSISNITFTIIMPKEFDSSKLGFSSGPIGSTDSSKITYNVNNNIINGSYEGTLEAGEALTVRLELPEGYFVNAGFKVSPYYYLMFIIPFIALLISFILWNLYGKNDHVVETVEFYPPHGFNSLEIAFLYKGKVDTKDVISLLIYLANKGYIKITEIEKKSLFSIKNDFIITKLKEYDGSNEEEKIFLTGLFKNSKSIDLDKVKKIMADAKANGKKLNYLEAMKLSTDKNGQQSVTKKDLYDKFYKIINKIILRVNKKENKSLIFEKTKEVIRVIIVLLIIVSLVTIFSIPTFEYAGIGEVLITLLLCAFYTPFYIIGIFSSQPISFKIFGLGFIMLHSFFFFLVLPIGQAIREDYRYFIGLLFGILCIIGMELLFKLMPKRTKYGNEMLGKINGFKKFLKKAEKQKLEAMVMENPTYFYDILPFTYVLGISNTWIKKFEAISLQAPDWYDGTSSFNVTSFGSFMNSTMSSSSASNSSSSSGSSSSGGSSGGGSSGGGSGGGGGGSW